ncbi:MAG: VWA containing CoxE family protein, partial [Mycobacterium sp.]
MNTPLLLRGVDLAAFAAALAARLRGAGITVSISGQGSFVRALQELAPRTTPELYWAARLTLVTRMEDLGTFDAVLREVFGSIQPGDTRRPESVLPIAGPKTPAAPAPGIVQPA